MHTYVRTYVRLYICTVCVLMSVVPTAIVPGTVFIVYFCVLSVLVGSNSGHCVFMEMGVACFHCAVVLPCAHTHTHTHTHTHEHVHTCPHYQHTLSVQ